MSDILQIQLIISMVSSVPLSGISGPTILKFRPHFLVNTARHMPGIGKEDPVAGTDV